MILKKVKELRSTILAHTPPHITSRRVERGAGGVEDAGSTSLFAETKLILSRAVWRRDFLHETGDRAL